MKEEIRRCEHLKRQTVGHEVHKARSELTEFWDRCCVSQEQRAAFLPFYDGSYCRVSLIFEWNYTIWRGGESHCVRPFACVFL